MLGRMMDFPLSVSHLIERAEQYFAAREIVSTRPDKSKHRGSYGDLAKRARRLARALTTLGVKQGDRVATLCWNHQQHLEAYFAVPAMGAIVHTLNLRLHPSEIGYIAAHAEDSVVIVDQSLLPLFDKFKDAIKSLKHVIIVADKGEPVASQPNMHDYEKIVGEAKDDFVWPSLDENTAMMLCYTSGTTGNPKGVLYSHRSTILHALVGGLTNHLGVGIDDVVLPVVPMFHAAAWGLPYLALLTGAKLVFPGPHLDPASLLLTMESERVTVAGGVPTIWLGILATLDADPKKYDLKSVRTMVIGGSAAPPSLIEGFKKRHGLEVTHAWGMTETNPLGTVARVKPHLRGDIDKELPVRATQGFAVPFFETRHVDDQGKILPRDGDKMGELEVRGPWVAKSYFGDEGKDRFTKDGWFKTGDVVKIDAEGYITITDREKDVIKSGGEWVSSVNVENALMSHPSVLEAAVFAGKHPKWDERPVAAIVWKPGQEKVSEAELSSHIEPRVGKLAVPDAYVYPEQIPRTSTGKFLKTKLREQYGDVLMPKK